MNVNPGVMWSRYKNAIWARLRLMFKRKPLTAVEQLLYDDLTRMGYEQAKTWIKDHCAKDYKLTIGHRGVQRWISENAKHVAEDYDQGKL